MAQLEAVFISNVILYLRSMETIIKLIKVNKKCQEATKILRYYKTRKIYEGEGGYFNFDFVVIKNIFEVFPNIETIKCRYQDIINDLKLFDNINQIELYKVYSDEIKLPQEIKDKIIKLDIDYYSTNGFCLNEFPNLKKVKVDFGEEKNLKEFLGDNQIKLKQLIIQIEDNEELDCLKDYKNIEIKIIKLINKITKERFKQLQLFANVYTRYPIDGLDIKNTICSYYGNFKISKEFDISRLYELTLFTKCFIECDCDLRKCEFLQKIETLRRSKNKFSIQIEGLKYLKKISFIKNVDCIPSNVSKISFNIFSFNYKELLEKNGDCFDNIKRVDLEGYWYDEIHWDFKVLKNFKNCNKIKLINQNDFMHPFEFPLGVNELLIHYCDDEEQIFEIEKLIRLKKLSIEFNPLINKQHIQKLYENLKELEWLRTNSIEALQLPSTVTYLELDLEGDINLNQNTNLKEMRINCFSNNYEVKLPKKLKKLFVEGSVIVKNSREIEVDRVILCNTRSQFCQWKSENVYIQQEYKEVV